MKSNAVSKNNGNNHIICSHKQHRHFSVKSKSHSNSTKKSNTNQQFRPVAINSEKTTEIRLLERESTWLRVATGEWLKTSGYYIVKRKNIRGVITEDKRRYWKGYFGKLTYHWGRALESNNLIRGDEIGTALSRSQMLIYLISFFY